MLLSNQLNATFGSLWIHLDVQENIRYISYSDFDTKTEWKSFEINVLADQDCTITETQKYARQWADFFNYLWTRHLCICKKKQEILQPLLTVLQHEYNKGSTKTKFNQCEMQLKKFIAKTKIIVFSPNDKIMHAMKMPFAFFSEQKKTKKFHGILLKTDDKNTIISLNASFMQFENVMQFFGVISNSTNHLLANYYDDIEFKQIAKDWGINSSTLKNVVSMPVIDLELLKNQLVYLPGQIVAHKINLQTFLNRRGKLLVNILHKTFALFCTFFSQKYLLDLHTSQISSFPSLSFTLVWLKYCIQGGPFLHGPEKIKSGYEKLLRQYSKGGFSWSFGGKIDSGEVFKNKNGQHQATAKSIIELDICSSYGFGAANMSCPSGFTVGYFTSSPQNKNNLIVENCDSFRHRHYEFRATYFFVLCLIKEGAEIVSIYSNYHLLGIFYVAQYPLDLFVVTKHHGNHLVQFDHLFTHGCRYGCSGLNKYAGNKTRLQLENQSQQRDNTIYQWIQDLGKENFYYHIVAECHTNGFNMKNLNAAYIHEPILHNLIKPYLKLPSKEFVLLNLPKLDSDLTFILFCQGHIPKKTNILYFHLYLYGKWTKIIN